MSEQNQDANFPVKPFGSQVLIVKEDINQKLIQVNGETENVARVLAVGDGTPLNNGEVRPPKVSPGDLIVVGGNLLSYRVGSHKFVMINEGQIIGTVNLEAYKAYAEANPVESTKTKKQAVKPRIATKDANEAFK